jgi:hypothetical protein
VSHPVIEGVVDVRYPWHVVAHGQVISRHRYPDRGSNGLADARKNGHLAVRLVWAGDGPDPRSEVE